MTASGIPTLTTTHRVSDRVHRGAADMRPTPHPSLATRFAQDDEAVFEVSDLADGGPARDWQTADFTRGQSDLGPLLFAGIEDSGGPGTSAQLTASTRLHLDVVDGGP